MKNNMLKIILVCLFFKKLKNSPFVTPVRNKFSVNIKSLSVGQMIVLFFILSAHSWRPKSSDRFHCCSISWL